MSIEDNKDLQRIMRDDLPPMNNTPAPVNDTGWSERIGMLRQWLNEDRITDPKKMVTNEDIERWLSKE